jgi:hypothetical protein
LQHLLLLRAEVPLMLNISMKCDRFPQPLTPSYMVGLPPFLKPFSIRLESGVGLGVVAGTAVTPDPEQ